NQFSQEANILSSLTYAHLVPIFGVVNDPGEDLQMVTELLPGFSFRHCLRMEGR
ncbi:hypothetical protein MKX03_012893, partial [Papaver bracteatum]